MRSFPVAVVVALMVSAMDAPVIAAQAAGDSVHIAEALGQYVLNGNRWPVDSSRWYGESRTMERSFAEAIKRQVNASDAQMLPFCSDRERGQQRTAWLAIVIEKWHVDSAEVLVTRDAGPNGALGCAGQTGQPFQLHLTPDGWRVVRVGEPRLARP